MTTRTPPTSSRLSRPGRLEERRRERPQALPDVVEVGAGGPGRGGRGQRVRDVHPGPAAERRRDQVRVQDAASSAARGGGRSARPRGAGWRHERRVAAAGVAVDPVEAVLALLGRHAEEHDPAGAVAAHPVDVAVVGVEDRASPSAARPRRSTPLTFASWPIELIPPRPRWSPVTLVTTATSLRS